MIKVKARAIFDRIASPHSFGVASYVDYSVFSQVSSPYNRASTIIASAITLEIDSHIIVRAPRVTSTINYLKIEINRLSKAY